jgi:hypothetical protein
VEKYTHSNNERGACAVIKVKHKFVYAINEHQDRLSMHDTYAYNKCNQSKI